MTDSPVADKFVAAPDNWSRNGKPIRAIVVHMAEGGGTVSWLTRNDGNSSHYVVEYDGSCTQMVAESRAAGSINPKLLRTTNDPAFTYLGERIVYGVTAAKGCLGSYWSDPNAAVIAFEVEGFAATGPNPKQRDTLRRLVTDIRHRHGAPYPTLGHRDFQAYKACPGHRIAWADFGGHGRASLLPVTPAPTPGETTVASKGYPVPEVPTRLWLRDDPAKAGRSRWLYVWDDNRADPGNKQLEPNRPVLLTRLVDGDTYAVAYESTTPDANLTSQEYFVKTVDILKTEPISLGGDTAAAHKAGRTAALDEIHAAETVARGKE